MILDKALQGCCMPCIIFKRRVVSHIEAKGQAHPSVWSIRVHLVGGVPYQSLGHKQGRCPISKVNPVSMSG